MKIFNLVTGDKWQVTGTGVHRPYRVTCRVSRVTGFTMVEIAISVAIIGLALVAILGVLPLGINVQRDNREETLIDQDASVFVANISQGAHGLDDLTNYVYEISNSWTLYNYGTRQMIGQNSYTYTNVSGPKRPFVIGSKLTNGANIIGLLSMPEYTDEKTGIPIPNLLATIGYSNHIVAYVRSLSGPASEKPPQDNPIVLGDTFSYKIICNNAPVAVAALPWQNQPYDEGAQVVYKGIFWRATAAAAAADIPGVSSSWVLNPYPQQLDANLHELRLTFLWPLLPDGDTGYGRHTFATTVAGQIVQTNVDGYWLYFCQPQSFTNAP